MGFETDFGTGEGTLGHGHLIDMLRHRRDGHEARFDHYHPQLAGVMKIDQEVRLGQVDACDLASILPQHGVWAEYERRFDINPGRFLHNHPSPFLSLALHREELFEREHLSCMVACPPIPGPGGTPPVCGTGNPPPNGFPPTPPAAVPEPPTIALLALGLVGALLLRKRGGPRSHRLIPST